jgi:hypothetical protein
MEVWQRPKFFRTNFEVLYSKHNIPSRRGKRGMHQGMLSKQSFLKSSMRAKSQPTKPEPIETERERSEEGLAAVSHASCSLKNNCCCLMNYFKLSIKVKIKKWFMRSVRGASAWDVCMRVYSGETRVLRRKCFFPRQLWRQKRRVRERLAVVECLETDALKDAFARVCGIAQSAPK